MSLILHNPGMLATVQDLGRNGFATLGVSRSGAADTLSLRVGNRLLSNPDHAAAIEFTLVGGSIECTRATPIVLAGATCDASIRRRDGTRTPLHMWTPAITLPGDTIHIGAIGSINEGCRVYLCVMGGIDTPQIMTSRATQVGTMLSGGHWSGGVGGLATASASTSGTPLRAGDAVPIASHNPASRNPASHNPASRNPASHKPASHNPASRNPAARTRLITASLRALCQEAIARRVIRVTPGPQFHLLSPSARAALHAPRRVLDRFDRRGVRLSPGIALDANANTLPTQPTDIGFIQSPGAEELIILGPDGPPTGGYPVVACVASVDITALGQLRPRDTLRFETIDVPHARQLLRSRWHDIDAELPPR